MKLENPWIAAKCREHDVSPNRLPTFLQEQYGQLGEDLILEATLKSYFARQGLPLTSVRYLEVGANHPIQTSNTYLFQHKWGGRGVLVEANPALVPDLQRVRPTDQVLHYAVVPPGYPEKVSINIATNSELSSIDAQHVRSFGAIGQVERTVEVPTVTLDELLQHCFPEGLHLLSIDIEGLDLEVIRASVLPRRPVFIVTEPSRHYHHDAERGFAEAMRAKGYIELARTDYNLIFGDAAALERGRGHTPAAAARRGVRTFDIFDTLIARHCIRPEPLFVELERRSGIAGLAQARFDAERRVEQGEYELSDIYAELARALDLSPEQAQEIASMELQLELENVVPVRDQLDLVDGDSVLVTDMYLPEDAIRLLLEKAGLRLDVPIVRTSHGKRTGRVWQDFDRAGWRAVHLGDNHHSDVQTAARHGARATLTSLAQPTPVEKHLYANGFPKFAQALRSARLMTSARDMPDWLLRLQTQLNLPVLVAASAMLLVHMAQGGGTQALFASRDGRHLKMAFDALRTAAGRAEPVSRYWYTSRIARTSGDPLYLEYCRRLFEASPVIVDLCGTGSSIAKLFADLRLGSEDRPLVYLCEFVEDDQQESALRKAYGLREDDALQVMSLLSTRSFVNNEVLELLNATPEGMVRGVTQVAGRIVPLRDDWEFDAEAAQWVRAQSRYVTQFTGHLEATACPAVLEEISTQGAQLLSALHDAAALLRADTETLFARMLAAHRSNEVTVLQELAGGRR